MTVFILPSRAVALRDSEEKGCKKYKFPSVYMEKILSVAQYIVTK